MVWSRLSRTGRKTRTAPGYRLGVEALEVRSLLSGDPSLSLVLASHTIAENAGPGATTGTVTRNNMDTSQALTVNLASNNTTQATVPANVVIPAGAASATFNVNAVDNHVVTPTQTVTITGTAPSPVPVGPDATFGSGGYRSTPTLWEHTSADFPGVKVQPDGKIVAVAGSTVSGASWAVSRTLPDGTLDPNFGTNGVVQTTFPNEGTRTDDGANALAIQPDGKIVVVGIIAGVPGDNYEDWGIARYNTDGTLDGTFGTGGLVRLSFPGTYGWAYDVAVLADGHILVAGSGGGFTVARFTSTGQLDTSFGSGGFARASVDPSNPNLYGNAQAMAVQPDGKIVITGVGSYTSLPVVRFNANGTLDTTFGGNGVKLIPTTAFGSYSSIDGMGLALQPDGKIVVSGYAYSSAMSHDDIITARLNPDGTLDTGFSGDGVDALNFNGYSSFANDVVVQADGKIVVAGYANVGGSPQFYGQGYNLALARYNPDGSLDASFHDTAFNSPGKYVFNGLSSIFEEIWGVSLQPDGKLAAVVGYYNNLDIARFDMGLLVGSDSLAVTDADNQGFQANAGGPYYVPNGGSIQLDASGTTDPNQDPATLTYSWDLNGDGTIDESGVGDIHPTFSAAGLTGPSAVVVHLTVTDNNGQTSSAQATVNVTGPPVNVTIGDVSQLEGNSGTTNFVFPVSLDAAVSYPVTVTYATADGTATANDRDYAPASGSVTFAPGQTTQNITVGVFGDTVVEPDETFFVNLTGATNGNLTRTQATGTIVNDDGLTASNDAYSVNENQVLSVPAPGVLGNDTAANSTPLQAALVTGPSHGTLTLNADGSFTYTPTTNFSGTDSFTYQATEGTLTSNQATVTITVNFVNQPPVARNDSYTILEDHTLTITPVPPVTSLTMTSQKGDYIGQGQTYSYDANTGKFGVQRNFDNGVSFNYTDSANPGYVWWYLDFAAPAKATLVPGFYGNAVRYPFQSSSQPGLDIAGEGRGSNTLTGNFTVKQAAYDASGNVLAFDVTFEQHSEGATPALTGEMKYGMPGGPSGVLANDTDPENEPLTAILVSDPAHGTLTLNADGTFSYTPNANYTGIDTFTYKANDGSLDSNVATVTLTITPVAATHFLVTAPSSSSTAGSAFNVTVTAQDADNNTATGYTGTIHFTSSDPLATVPADYTFTSADNGQHTFTNGVTLATAGKQTVTATDTGTSSVTGAATVSVAAAAATGFSLAAPATSTAGTALTITVTAYDPYGNVATGYTGTVHFTSSDAKAKLPADYTFTSSDAGTHTFTSGVTLATAGKQTVTATDTATNSLTSSAAVQVSPAAASGFVVSIPSASTAGTAFDLTVTADDAYGNVATGYTGTVDFTSSDAKAELPADYTFTANDQGRHTFAKGVTLDTAGTQTVTATDTATKSVTGSGSVSVSPAAASTLGVSAPSGSTAGAAFTITVTAQDAFGNTATGYTGTVQFGSSDADATLPDNYTFIGSDNGTHTFTSGVTLKTAGQQTVTATDTTTGSITGSAAVQVTASSASSLTVTGFPSSDTAGVAHNFTVTAYDAYGNVATGYTGTLHFTSSDGQAALPADYTFTGGDAGTHSLSVTLKTAGSQSLTATDTNTASLTVTQSGITVAPAAAQSFGVAGFPSPDTAGVAHNVTVTAYDAYGNVATGYTGTVHFTSSDNQAALPADSTLTNGSGSFSVTLKTAVTESLTATDTNTATITGTEGGITVNPAAAATLQVSGTATATAGTAATVTVTALDAYGNVATGYTGTMHFTSSDGQATLPGDYTFTSSDAGTHTFTNGVTLLTAGSQSVTATDTASGSITGALKVTVSPASASTFLVTGYSSATTAGTDHNFTVTALDAYGNVATGYTGTVHFASSDGQAILPADYTFTGGDAGVHTFSATLKTAGSQSITATDTKTASITGTQSGISVSAAAASVFVITGYPSTTAGTAHNFTVTAYDAYGNVATGYTGTVHLTSSDGQATLPADYTFTGGDAGVRVFTATLKAAGSQSITVTDTKTASITGTQSGIAVSAAAVTHFAVTSVATVKTGTAFTVTVTALDAYGNVVTGYRGKVHFTSTDHKAGLPADYTFTGSDAGVHSFQVTLRATGTQKITVTDTAHSSITGTDTVTSHS
jgi:uncharacterized delta-60 repeat protein